MNLIETHQGKLDGSDVALAVGSADAPAPLLE